MAPEAQFGKLQDSGQSGGVTTVPELLAAGHTAAQLRAAGVPAGAMHEAEVSAATMLLAGYTVQELHDDGYDVQELTQASVSPPELKAGGITAADIHGVLTAAEIHGVYSAEDMLGSLVDDTAQAVAHYDQHIAQALDTAGQFESFATQFADEVAHAEDATAHQLEACEAQVGQRETTVAERLAGEHHEAVASLEQVESTSGEQGTLLTAARQQWDEAHAELQTTLQAGQQTLHAGQEEVRAAFVDGAAATSELEQQLGRFQEEAHTVWQALGQQLDHLLQQAETLHTDTEATLSRVGLHLSDLQNTQVSSLFETMRDQLSQQQRLALTDHLTSSDAALATAWQGFSGQATQSASELAQRATDILHNLAQHCTDRLHHELQHLVHEVIETVIRELLQEIGLAAILMETGASVTATMSPILPELAAAKAVIATINHLLEIKDNLTGGLPG